MTVLLCYDSGVQVGSSKNECAMIGGKWGPQVDLTLFCYLLFQTKRANPRTLQKKAKQIMRALWLSPLFAQWPLCVPWIRFILQESLFARLFFFILFLWEYSLSFSIPLFFYKLNRGDARQALQIDYSLKHLLDYHGQTKQSRGWELSSGLEFHYSLVIGMLACFYSASWLQNCTNPQYQLECINGTCSNYTLMLFYFILFYPD